MIIVSCSPTHQPIKILYFSKDITDVHANKLKNAGRENGWKIIVTNDEHYFHEDSLSQMNAVFLPFSSLNQLGYKSVPALKRYLEAGGGGIVTLRDTLLNQARWPWLQSWNEQKDGDKWTQDKGWLNRIKKDYREEDLKKALSYTIGKNQVPDYTKVKTLNVPDSSRYTRTVLAHGLDEPLQMAILPNNNVLFVERKGGVKVYDAESKNVKTIVNFNVFSGIEDGLLGVVLDPDFKTNHWAYFYYAPAGPDSVDRLSRFDLIGDSLLLGSERILLQVPTQRTYCCHSAGGMAFGPDGLLYISVGDNTNADDPYKEGYMPVDERPGHELADDQGTAANTNNLRGKILRIKPEPDGSYSIPDGNLFPKGTPKTKPEIYIMGLRNPYRFTIDEKTNILYWGEVGPATKVLGRDGSFMSYDEVNRAKKSGFYGWPYFLGDNDAFPLYDFATKKEGPRKDPFQPINNSRNNTGLRELPPAQPAMIWYGSDSSKRFPLVGSGGASIMAGPVYHSDLFPNSPYKLSDYYNGKLFIYEWIRHWIMAVTFDEQGNYLRMEPFLKHLQFAAPIDMKFGPDGALYILEYGTNWFSKNTDAELVRIEYQEGNRNPVAEVHIDNQYGTAPLNVQFSGKKSIDHDRDDQLSYNWSIDNKEFQGETVRYTFARPGVYMVTLTVSDDKGGKGIATSRVFVGNTPPEVHIQTAANRSFYWDNSVLDYSIAVKDKEETTINPDRIKVSYGYVPRGKDVAVILTKNQDTGNFKYLMGQQMVATLDCKSCHSMDKASVGPTYLAISDRYAGKDGSVTSLSDKIIQGGSGAWGERAMSPHPALSTVEATEVVNYILSLSDKSNAKLPLKDAIVLKEHIGKGTEGSYLLNASYTDQGANGIEPLQSRDHITLRNPIVQAEDFDEGNVQIATITTAFYAYARGINHNSYIRFNKIDLRHVRQLKYRVQPLAGGKIEVRLDKADGPLISSVSIPAGIAADPAAWKEITASLNETIGIHNLYFVFTDPEGKKKNLFNIDWIYFSNTEK